MAATVAVITTTALSAGIADAKAGSPPKKLNQSTANNIVAVVRRALGAGWTVQTGAYTTDSRATKYPLPNALPDPAGFTQNHAKMVLGLARVDTRDVSQGGNLYSYVYIVSFPRASNANKAEASVPLTPPAGNFETAVGSLGYYNKALQGTSSNGQPGTLSGYQTQNTQVNAFVMAVTTLRDPSGTRTDALPVLQAVTKAVVKYLKTGR